MLRSPQILGFLFLFVFLAGRPAEAWTPKLQAVIAQEAEKLAPPDLGRQIAKHRQQWRRGVVAALRSQGSLSADWGARQTDALTREVHQRVEAAIRSIEEHRPFDQVVFQLGEIAYLLSLANNPLLADAADSEEARYFQDYLRYAESAQRRFPLVFYGLMPELDDAPSIAPLLRRSLERGRRHYPLIGQEYRRVEFRPGVEAFDDRSTAFGVASLSFSRAVSDIALMLRYVWLRAGGADSRNLLPVDGERILQLPRVTGGGEVGRRRQGVTTPRN